MSSLVWQYTCSHTGVLLIIHLCVFCSPVCGDTPVFVPAEAASTLPLSAVVVPQSDVSLVERCFTQTALKGGGPQRCRALTSHTQSYHLFTCIPPNTSVHLIYLLPESELPGLRCGSLCFCRCLKLGMILVMMPLPRATEQTRTPADGLTEKRGPQTCRIHDIITWQH